MTQPIDTTETPQAPRLGRDFQRYWQSYTVNATGSALAAGALPLVAIVVLHADALQVSLLAAVGSIAAAIISLPLGAHVDRADKRTIMITTDVVQFAAVASVPLAAAFGALTFAHLCLIAIIQTTCAIAANSSAFAYVKQAVPVELRTLANSRTDTVAWTTQTLGPPAGGALIGLIGPTVTLIADAASYLASALLLRRVTPAPPAADAQPAAVWSRRELFAGWSLLLREPGLRALYFNAMIFGGAITWSSPLIAILMLREAHATPLQYGIALGIPGLGGLAGAWLSPKIATRLGTNRTMLIFGLARTPWLLALPLAGSGWAAVAVITGSQLALMSTAGIFNPLFSTYRMTATPDHLMARVSAAWSVTAKSVQPLFITAGGVLATVLTIRSSLLVAGAFCVTSALFLPWRTPATPQG
ncbi:MFS transporter [Longispora fulva]|uniref:Putative MFS family arabinose efflux permease n=1 Tax=Longispora fulva TaxID=619741 RepID=A0A8J7GTT8_9ACTN|nr:MFS transporter [Longispora fulva]MBG6138344.1 putative MFS family arabinose efflux permease [Longispora fulva]GIG60596.1 MFS transporter [Longispora fulva]